MQLSELRSELRNAILEKEKVSSLNEERLRGVTDSSLRTERRLQETKSELANAKEVAFELEHGK